MISVVYFISYGGLVGWIDLKEDYMPFVCALLDLSSIYRVVDVGLGVGEKEWRKISTRFCKLGRKRGESNTKRERELVVRTRLPLTIQYISRKRIEARQKEHNRN